MDLGQDSGPGRQNGPNATPVCKIGVPSAQWYFPSFLRLSGPTPGGLGGVMIDKNKKIDKVAALGVYTP